MSEAVLVLNANFEPVNICDTRRAVGLIITGKASLVLNGRGFIRTVSTLFPRPSVIRLEKMIHRPRPTVHLNRKEILRRDHFTCQYCGKKSADLTIDHVIPRRLGGVHAWTNVVAACIQCNFKKGGRTPEQANMILLHQPHIPPSSLSYVFNRHLAENASWEPFIQGW
jgi:5-methylcytosine-specific restriction endonuclease McrA